jgi:murein L,D-transpeptidase YcbB/YkuD
LLVFQERASRIFDVVNAVKEFQKAKGFDVDGIAGAVTLQALGID